MNIWGDYAIVSGVRHNLLKKPEFYFDIRPLTANDELAVQKAIQRTYRLEDNRFIQPTNLEVAIYEVAAAYGYSNIPLTKETVKDGKLIQEHFDPPAPGSTFDTIVDYVKSMPYVVVEELWGEVGKANPTMGPKMQKEMAEKLEQIYSAVKRSTDPEMESVAKLLEDLLG